MRNKENNNKWQRENYHRRKNEPDYKKRCQASARRYYLAHIKEYLAKGKKYRDKQDKEEYRKYRREYRWKNPTGIYSVLREHFNRRHLLKISKEDFVQWYLTQDKKCFYCKRTLDQVKKGNDILDNRLHRLTIDRMDNEKGYQDGNITLACYRCNSIKSNYFTVDEMLTIGKIINEKTRTING